MFCKRVTFVNILIYLLLPIESDLTIRCAIKFNNTRIFNNNSLHYECPDPLYDLPQNTACCRDRDRCCPPQPGQSPLFIISVVGIIICIIFIIFLLTCGFFPTCPLYNSCKTYQTRDKTSYAGNMGEVASLFQDMPGEGKAINNTMVFAHPLKEEESRNDQKKLSEAV